MRKHLLSVAAFVSILFVTDACVDHDLASSIPVDCSGAETVSYNDHIKPIVVSICSNCHNTTDFPERDWTNPVLLHEYASEASRRVRLSTTDPDHMPKDPPELTLDQIKSIVCWAEQGAPIDN